MKETTPRKAAKKQMSILQIALIGLMTAVLCILGPIAVPVPVSPVPISAATFVIFIAVYVLGMKYGAVSCAIYLLLGTAGLPVFSGFGGGFSKLAGPTGGYLLGYLFTAAISGFFIDKFPKKYGMHILGMTMGTLVCYLFGTVWLCTQMKLTFWAGLVSGVIPYVPGDALKIAAAVFLGPVLRRAVYQFKVR